MLRQRQLARDLSLYPANLPTTVDSMLLGHYGVALAAKRFAPRTSLGTTILAAQLLDELWPIFLLLGLEEVRVIPGLMAASPFDFVHYPITHSLVGACAWALLLGGVYFLVRRYKTGAWVVGVAVVSHWVLDLPMHRPDLPLWPGADVKVGLGLWSSIPATIAIELLVLGTGLTIYLRRTRPRDWIGSWALWAMVLALLAIFFAGFVSPPPPSPRAVALSTLGIWLFIPWGYWVDRHRDVLPA